MRSTFIANKGLLGDGVDDLCRGRRDHVADLVGDTCEGGAKGVWREFLKVDWDDTPSEIEVRLHFWHTKRMKTYAP